MPDGSLPGWPRAMKEKLAAAYVGMSTTTFRERVMPHIRRVHLSPGRVAWLKEDLDRWLDLQAGGLEPAQEVNPWHNL